MTEIQKGSEQVDLKKDLPRFVDVISTIGREFGLNPHLEVVHLENTIAEYHPVIAAISESGFVGKLKQIVGAGNIARILEAPPRDRDQGVDYFFIHNSRLKTDVFSRLHSFTCKVEEKTGVRIFLAPKTV